MTNLLPAKVAPYVKAWVSLIGVIVSAVVLAVPDAPKWVAVLGAVLASVGVYFGKNGDKAGETTVKSTPAPPL